MSKTIQGWIYKITNTVNGKVYIGKTIHLKDRFNSHINSLKKNKHCNNHLQAAWNKYGESAFVFEVIEEFNPEMNFDLDNLERYWIEQYNSMNSSKGYNKTPGGDGTSGYKWTEEQKLKLKKIMVNKIKSGREHHFYEKPAWNKGLKNICKPNEGSFKKNQTPWNKGKSITNDQKERLMNIRLGTKHSEETKLKMSKSRSGEKSKIRKQVKCLNNDKTYSSLKEASAELNVLASKISLVCSGKQKHTKGFKFQYLENKEAS